MPNQRELFLCKLDPEDSDDQDLLRAAIMAAYAGLAEGEMTETHIRLRLTGCGQNQWTMLQPELERLLQDKSEFIA